jgi:hypothetical protein
MIALAVALFALAAVTRLVPTDYRPFNATAVGAVALFAASRFGFGVSLLISALAMLVSGGVLWWQHDFHADYAPYASTYLGLIGYAAFGALRLKHNNRPLGVAGAAFGGSLVFFLITNAFSWVSPLHNYDRSLAGLIECYTAAIPFYRTMLAGDVLFSVSLFALATVAAKFLVSTPNVELVPVRETSR